MSRFKVRKDSWHFRWLALYSTSRDAYSRTSKYDENIDAADTYADRMKYRWRYNDFCSYWRAVIVWPAFRIFFSNLPVAIALYLVLAIGIQYTAIGIGAVVSFLIALVAAGAIGYLIYRVFAKGVAKAAKSVTENEMFETAYSSYKDNICVLVEMEE